MGNMEVPQVNLVMQAEQWKARVSKEDDSYMKGRNMRQKDTNNKLRECRTRFVPPLNE